MKLMTRSLLTFLTVTAALPAFAESLTTVGQSARDLPRLSGYLIHHFDCKGSIVNSIGSKEETFSFAPVGGKDPRNGVTVSLGDDEIQTSGNAQMLRLDWRRAGKPIASAMMMIKNSPTQAFVLLVGDPNDDGNQASVDCLATTFAEMKGTK